MILITGATGGLGNATINSLLEILPSEQIAALVRDKQKATLLIEKGIDIRIGDYDSYESLVKAFSGIDKLLLVSAPALSDLRYKRESNVINAAKEAGVKHIFYTGIQHRKDRQYIMPMVTEISILIEQMFKESGMYYTVIENTIYAEAVPLYIGNNIDQIIEHGVIFNGNGSISYASRADLGEGIAKILTSENHENKKYTLSNTQSWSFSDIASILSVITEKEIVYRNVGRKDYINHKVTVEHYPSFVAEFFADWGDAATNGEFEETDPMLEKLLGRKPQKLNEFLRNIY